MRQPAAGPPWPAVSPPIPAATRLMHYLDLTLPTPAENLALDEALLEEAETAADPLETLRAVGADRPAGGRWAAARRCRLK